MFIIIHIWIIFPIYGLYDPNDMFQFTHTTPPKKNMEIHHRSQPPDVTSRWQTWRDGARRRTSSPQHMRCRWISAICWNLPTWETLRDPPNAYHFWLVVSTPLKNISQLGWLFPIYGKKKCSKAPIRYHLYNLDMYGFNIVRSWFRLGG